ncbi:MAG: acyl-CoA thioesterase [Bacteroidales bacterium]|nr:acyl-CoA thioesterase [Bacteroidales bacterium]
MISGEIKTRIRYSETDQMGYVYHGNYAQFYEIARTELIRRLGFPYKVMEKQGFFMPVLELHSRFIKPAHYDELITIKTTVREMPTVRMTFNYNLFNETGELINQGHATLVFLDGKTNRPCRPPAALVEAMKPYFS